MNNTYLIIIIIVAIIIGFFISYLFYSGKDIIIEKPVIVREIRIDTIIKLIKRKPIILKKAKADIIQKVDTLNDSIVNPFIAMIDTIVFNDTVKAEFEYPENLFSLEIKHFPDSLIFEKIYIQQATDCKREWWEVPTYISSGAIVGIIIGLLVK